MTCLFIYLFVCRGVCVCFFLEEIPEMQYLHQYLSVVVKIDFVSLALNCEKYTHILILSLINLIHDYDNN